MDNHDSPSIRTSDPKPQKTSKLSLRKIVIIIFSLLISLFVFAVLITIFIENKTPQDYPGMVGKPVIYLYPETKKDIYVQLDFQGTLIADFPKYDTQLKGWEVSASPDGSLVNYSDKKEYSYIFWEGVPEKKIDWDLSE